MRVASILKLLGWQKNFRTVAGKRCRVWCQPEPVPESDSESGTTTNTEKRGVDREDGAEDVQASIQSQQAFENQTQQCDRHELPKTPKKDIFSKTETAGVINADLSPNSEFRPDENSDSLGEKVEQVDRTNQPQSQQAFQSDRPDNCEVDRPEETEAETEAEAEEAELIGFIRYAIAENDSQFAKDIQKLLKEVCSAGAADRQKVWATLTEAEKSAFTALLSPTTTTAPTAPTAPTPEPEPESKSESAVESTGIEQEVISKEDGKKIREIATVWWNEFYPEQMQSLISQMFGWGAPGTKYCVEIINQWLKGEDDLIRYRIGELIKLKSTQK